jgi:hypothetical protein
VIREEATKSVSFSSKDTDSLADILEQTAAWLREHGEGKVIDGYISCTYRLNWIVNLVMSERDH